MKEDREIRQGDIYYARLPDGHGSIQKGDRPVVVVSADWLNKKSPNYKVAPLTSKLKATNMPTHVVLPKLKGLPKQSMVLGEQARGLPRENFLSYRCTLSDELYRKVDRAVRSSMRRKKPRHKNKRRQSGHRSYKNSKKKKKWR